MCQVGGGGVESEPRGFYRAWTWVRQSPWGCWVRRTWCPSCSTSWQGGGQGALWSCPCLGRARALRPELLGLWSEPGTVPQPVRDHAQLPCGRSARNRSQRPFSAFPRA